MRRFIDQRTIDKVWTLLEEHKPVAVDNKTTNDLAKEVSDCATAGKAVDEKNGKQKVKGQVDEVDIDSRTGESESRNENDLELEKCEGDSKKEKKRRKKSLNSTSEDAVESEGLNQEQNGSKKRKRKTTENAGEAAPGSRNDTEEEQSVDDKELRASGVDGPLLEEDFAKLSKKEKRERRKKEKYEAELRSIENDGNIKLEDIDVVPVDVSNQKKAKKQKGEIVNSEELEVVSDAKGKRKKHKANGNEGMADGGMGEGRNENGQAEVETRDKDAETPFGGEISQPKGKFKWDKVIVSALRSAPDNELLVKRLRKKVLAEYQQTMTAQGSCGSSLEEALGKFERKLHRIPAVKILKDRAKLIKTSD